MAARHQIESHKFWDIVALWAKEQQESEEVVARALAKAVLRYTEQEPPSFWFARGEGAA